MPLLWDRLSDIEWRECHEDKRLKKCNKKLKKPERECENLEKASIEKWYLISDIYNHCDKYRTDENIEK